MIGATNLLLKIWAVKNFAAETHLANYTPRYEPEAEDIKVKVGTIEKLNAG